jgi:hypothetical protein
MFKNNKSPIIIVLILLTIILPKFNPAPVYQATDPRAQFVYLPALFAGQPFHINPWLESSSPNYKDFAKWSPTGNAVNMKTIGGALLFLPFYSAGYALDGGHFLDSPAIWWGIALAGLFYGIVGCLLLFFVLRKFFPETTSAIVVIAVFIASPVIVYASKESGYSHSPSFFLSCVMLWMVVRMDWARLKTWLLWGVVIGISALLRPQMVIFGIMPLAVCRPRAKYLAASILVAFVLFFPQLLMWKMTFGEWFVNPQNWVAQHSGFAASFFHAPAVWQVLFNPKHGLFLWHPLLLLSSIGLVGAIKNTIIRRLAIIAILIFALQTLANSSAWDWWAAKSFGNRRFCDCLPLLAVGLAFLLSRSRRWLILIIPLVLYGLVLYLRFGQTFTDTQLMSLTLIKSLF